MRKSIKIIYWILTGFLALQLATTGVGDIVLAPQIVKNIVSVGFPINLVPFLGFLKLGGAMVLVFVSNIHLKIGAYAAVFFYALGAVAAHLTIGDPLSKATAALILLISVISSYLIWQEHKFPFLTEV